MCFWIKIKTQRLCTPILTFKNLTQFEDLVLVNIYERGRVDNT